MCRSRPADRFLLADLRDLNQGFFSRIRFLAAWLILCRHWLVRHCEPLSCVSTSQCRNLNRELLFNTADRRQDLLIPGVVLGNKSYFPQNILEFRYVGELSLLQGSVI